MAVPKKKTSPSRQGMRHSGKHVHSNAVIECNHCGEWRLPHHMCLDCGHYNGRHVMVTRSQQRELKAQQEESDNA